MKLATMMFVMLAVIFCVYGGKFLSVSSPPIGSEVCTPLTGNSEGRFPYAIDLYHKGLCKKLIFLGGKEGRETSYASKQRQIALSKGVRQDDIFIDERDIFSTYAELMTLQKVLTEHFADTTSISIVTDSYHTRRVRMVIDWMHTRAQIHNFVGISDNYGATSFYWLKSHQSRKAVVSEYVKIVYYYFAYRFPIDKVREWILQFEKIND